MKITNQELIKEAKSVAKFRKLKLDNSAGGAGCALVSGKNNIYLGVCIDTCCGMGFCAEVSAIAAMITAGESKIKKIVTVSSNGKILPSCGKCREFMCQIDDANFNTEVIIGENKIVKLKDLLPYHWEEKNI